MRDVKENLHQSQICLLMIHGDHISAKLSTVRISLFFACSLCQIVTRGVMIIQIGSSFQAERHYEVVSQFSRIELMALRP